MALFETLVPELQQRTGRRDEVERLFEALLAEMIDSPHGGLAGFLAHFSDAGFSGLVQSWLAHDAYAIASAAQIRYALGDALLLRLANAAGLSAGTAAMVLALMIPSVVHRLTPSGRVPTPRELRHLVEGRSGSTSAVAEDWDASADAATATSDAAEEHTWTRRLRTPSFLYGATIVWVLLIALAAWWSLRGEAVPAAASVAGAGRQPLLVLRHGGDGVITASGVLPDEPTRDLVVAELRRAYPASDWAAAFGLDPALGKPMWLANLKSLLPLVRTTTAGAEIRVEGDRIAVGGALSETDRATLRQHVASIFGRTAADISDSPTIDHPH